MATPQKILEHYGLRPLKRYGQSFLVDRNIMSRIVEKADIEPNDQVVEIGAGVGIMTGMIADRAGRVIALDADPKMIDVLKLEMAERSNVTILKQDVLSYDFSSVPSAADIRIRVVGNIPYNISSQILLRLIHFRNFISTAVLMFQKELAERIVAKPGTPPYGSLSVLASMYTRASRVISVSPSCFFPRPKVSSIVLKFEMRERPLFDLRDHELFHNTLRAAFAKRRKTLMNSLMDNPFIIISQERASLALKEVGIDPKRRGETLTPEEFARLSNSIRPEGNG